MNKQDYDILYTLQKHPFTNQRTLAEQSGYSLGAVNKALKNLSNENYINYECQLTKFAKEDIIQNAPKNAIILAAGFGMRMVPINLEKPKALLEVNGEILIERTIRHLHEAGVTKIYVVVGFMKECFEYLIDDYGVELIVNSSYATKNNLYSMKMVLDKLTNTYIIPCDIWCEYNPFNKNELYSWYMVSDLIDEDSIVRINRKNELVTVKDNSAGNQMIGICYLLHKDSMKLCSRILELTQNEANQNMFWEEALFDKNKMSVFSKVVPSSHFVEINTYEQLRELDSHSNHLKSNVINIISNALQVSPDDICNIAVLKKGMTNRSFFFTVNNQKYIMRIPGEGTDQLINRRQEAAVYQVIDGKNICDDIAYINPENGYKITKFLDGARVCNPENSDDIKKCMKRLRAFHELNLKVDHEFDVFGQLNFYESLWNGIPSIYKDYEKTKEKVFSLKPFIDAHINKKTLTHIDAVPDNFLFVEKNGKEEIRLIDWEYAGMQDPHLDIAMFCIYSLYNKEQVDSLIDAYFTEGCSHTIRIKIYCYIAVCGLLWSNWCEYKRNLGVEFGEYSLRQYRYAKDYYKIVQEELNKCE